VTTLRGALTRPLTVGSAATPQWERYTRGARLTHEGYNLPLSRPEEAHAKGKSRRNASIPPCATTTYHRGVQVGTAL
jgi:hypothetical protein